jgi:hypothetical protein
MNSRTESGRLTMRTSTALCPSFATAAWAHVEVAVAWLHAVAEFLSGSG